jgi:PPOX class probable F420-dependent enzyme
MVALRDDVREVLESNRVAHLVTLNPDGGQQVSCVWIGLDGDEILAASLGPWRKVKNAQRDARVALSVETSTPNPIGLINYVVVYGQARVQEGGAPELLTDLARTYLGPEQTFEPLKDDPPPGFVLRITADRVAGVGPWAGHVAEGRAVKKLKQEQKAS